MVEQIIKANIDLNTIRRQIAAMRQKPFHSRKKLRRLQAIEEGQRDILNTAITAAQSTSGVVDKNNYKTYASQVQQAYRMFNAEVDYGAEFMRGIVETRVAFISGEGLSVSAKNAAVRKYIEKFLKLNHLNGSRLMQISEVGELEGKALLILTPNKLKQYARVNVFSWYENNYTVEKKAGEFYRAVYREQDTDKEKEIGNTNATYIKLGGSWRDLNLTPSKLHTILTQIENASRAGYDLRKNSHHFGKITPYWKTENGAEAKSINNDVASENWKVGIGYAGTAQFSYVEPSGSSVGVIEKDLLLSLKAISSTTGIPLHWLAWPELMSNRATAENMFEAISAATRKERLLYAEGFHNLIDQSMRMAVDSGFEDVSIIGDFDVYLPVISVTLIKQLSETWLPLQQNDVISLDSLRGRIPGIDPLKEKKAVEQQKKENLENFRENSLVNQGLGINRANEQGDDGNGNTQDED